MIRVALGLGTSLLGNVNYMRNLLGAVLSRPDRRIDPVLLVGRRAPDAELLGFPEVEVLRTKWLDPMTPGWALRKAWQQALAGDPFLQGFLRSKRIDVLSHADFLSERSSIPTICWIGDFQHRRLPEFFSRSERLYRDRDFRLQCRHATRILLSSNDARDELARFEPECLAKARVVPFVAQPRLDARTPTLTELQRRYEFDGRYFLVPNQFWAHKNHGEILDALAILRGRGEDPLVLATGAKEDYRQPGYFDDLMGQARARGVQDSFRALGVVPYTDLVGLMVGAVALINPSRSEGWSTSVEEAKSLGKRIILSDLAVHREQAPPDGVYVDPDDPDVLADAMSRLWAEYDPEVDRERIERAQVELPGRVRAFGAAYEDVVMELVRRPEAR
jgi:glycosyltransferase involved in cell wall biosynthesis